jgi:hypothetical protein
VELIGAIDGSGAQQQGGVTFLVREATLKLKEAPRPMQWEWERVSDPVHGERWQVKGVTSERLSDADKRAVMVDIVHERGSFYTRHLGVM